MARKNTGQEGMGWQQYIAERYLWPALRHWKTWVPAERQALAYSLVVQRDPDEYRCLILGSNEGNVERFLCQWGFTGEIVASDIADKALGRARAEAERLGYTNICHVQADLNSDPLPPGKFDFVIAEGVLHHIANLDRCLSLIRESMSDGAIPMAPEFTGPFRYQLPGEQVFWINHVLRSLPRAVRMGVTGSPEDLLPAEPDQRVFVPHSEEFVATMDSSEAISSHQLDEALQRTFEVIERRPVGGTLMTYLQDYVDYRLAGQFPYSKWTEMAIDLEWALIERGLLNSDFVFYVLKR
jgi:hypothetical protein